jgi:hypothetical protein
MKDFPINLRTPSKLTERRLTLNILLRADDQLELRSCEVKGANFRNRTTFSEHTRLEDILVSTVAAKIRSAFASLPQGTQVLSLPDFIVELPGLVLAGAHILVTDFRDGLRSAIFRVKEFIGGINVAFNCDVGFHDSLTEQNERLATSILCDICLPVLNFFRHGDGAPLQRMQSDYQQIQDRAREFEFQTELLKRYVTGSVRGSLRMLAPHRH